MGAIGETRWTHVGAQKGGPLPGAYDRLPADRADALRDRFGTSQLPGPGVEANESPTWTVWPSLSDVGWDGSYGVMRYYLVSTRSNLTIVLSRLQLRPRRLTWPTLCVP